MVPVVLVHVASPPSNHAAAMIAACTAGLRRGYCSLSSRVDTDPTDATAVVSWIGDGYRIAHVEVHARGGETTWRERKLAFRPRDAISERWKVVGLTIATLVGDLEDDRSNDTQAVDPVSNPLDDDVPNQSPLLPSDQVARTPPEPSSAAPKTEPTGGSTLSRVSSSMRLRTWGSVTVKHDAAHAVASGMAFNPVTPRFGAWARAALTLARPAFATVALSYSVRPRDEHGVLVSWVGLSIGGGAALVPRNWPLAFRLRAELLLEREAASVDNSMGYDQQSRIVPALRGGVDLVWPRRHWLGLTASFDVIAAWQSTRLWVANQQTATLPALTYMFAAGPELRF